MTGYLLTFKHDKMSWPDLEERIERIRLGDTEQLWSSGSRSKNISVGAPAYLMRQGKVGPGIFGCGQIAREPVEEPHYDEDLRNQGKKSWQLKVNFTHLYDPREKIVIKKDELVELHPTLWNAQGSGRDIPSEIESKLRSLFNSRVGVDMSYPDEIVDDAHYREGARKSILVNAYERDSCPPRMYRSLWSTLLGLRFSF